MKYKVLLNGAHNWTRELKNEKEKEEFIKQYNRATDGYYGYEQLKSMITFEAYA